MYKPNLAKTCALWMVAVKSNIGHLEGGSGVAGLKWTIMILERAIVLLNAGFEQPNPRIDPYKLRIKVFKPSLSQLFEVAYK